MKTLLCTGLSGFLGYYVAEKGKEDWHIVGTAHNNEVVNEGITAVSLDITEAHAFNNIVEQYKPDAVLHMAASSDPNYCEQFPEQAAAVNIEGGRQVAQSCREREIPCLFTSTDLVFDGKYAPYSEEDVPRPINEYGRQKRKAELLMQKIYPDITIARMPLMFGWGYGEADNFFEHFYRKMQNGVPLTLFVDEFRTPVSGITAAQGLLRLLKQEVTGIYHLGGKERINRWQLGQAMKKIFDLPQAQMTAGKQSEMDMAAPRPTDVSLNSTKAFRLNYSPRSIEGELQLLQHARAKR